MKKLVFSSFLTLISLVLACDFLVRDFTGTFKLDTLIQERYDYYNPILSEFLVDSTEDAKSRGPHDYCYVVYSDSTGRVRYVETLIAGEFPLLYEYHYGYDSRLESVSGYQIGWFGGVERTGTEIVYSYRGNELAEVVDSSVVRIDLLGDSALVYDISYSADASLSPKKIAVDDYFIGSYGRLMGE